MQSMKQDFDWGQKLPKVSPEGECWIYTDGSVGVECGKWAVVPEETQTYFGVVVFIGPDPRFWGHYGAMHKTSFTVELVAQIEALFVIQAMPTNVAFGQMGRRRCGA